MNNTLILDRASLKRDGMLIPNWLLERLHLYAVREADGSYDVIKCRNGAIGAGYTEKQVLDLMGVRLVMAL
jgi:hypothetical protein